MVNNNLVGGWALPLWKMEFVSWDDDIPNWMETNMFQSTNQYIMVFFKKLIPENNHQKKRVSHLLKTQSP